MVGLPAERAVARAGLVVLVPSVLAVVHTARAMTECAVLPAVCALSDLVCECLGCCRRCRSMRGVAVMGGSVGIGARLVGCPTPLAVDLLENLLEPFVVDIRPLPLGRQVVLLSGRGTGQGYERSARREGTQGELASSARQTLTRNRANFIAPGKLKG